MIEGERISLRPLTLHDAPRMLALYQSNASLLAPWDPIRPAHFYSLAHQEDEIRVGLAAEAADRGYSFGIVVNQSGLLVGRLRLSNIVRGVFQNAYLGYWIDGFHAGRGLMTEAVGLALHQAFGDLRLHRVQAATLTNNAGSIAVLLKNGFRREGLAERYLLIAGHWQDHLLFAITAEDWQAHQRLSRGEQLALAVERQTDD
jgi:ribosomal-protein-alanine N-acetyltransferase